MGLGDYFLIFLLAFAVFMVIDLIWLGLIAKLFYRQQLKPYLAKQTNWPAAVLFYLLFVIGLCYFAVVPALRESSFDFAVGVGAAYGFFTYMTYDLTNLATIKKWPLKLVIVDIVWGTILSTLVSGKTYIIYTALT